MRIAGGIAKGRRLKPPAIPGARPTSELVRTAIFNVLGAEMVEGARVLDLFAGTGSLGIEALSRGAQWADLVEQNRRQCAVAQGNLEATGFSDQGQVYCMSVERALAELKGPYRLVLMDPPYKLPSIDPVLNGLDKAGLVENGGIIVVGHSKRQELQPAYGRIIHLKTRRYGDSVADFYKAGSV
jgi:16S rRNA (guanine(966)-N(2))-methyltransferase RsmD